MNKIIESGQIEKNDLIKFWVKAAEFTQIKEKDSIPMFLKQLCGHSTAKIEVSRMGTRQVKHRSYNAYEPSIGT